MEYVLIEGGKVVQGPGPLPGSHRNVSGLEAFTPAELAGMGWWPVTDVVETLGPRQQHGEPVLKVEKTRVVRHVPAVPMPVPQAVSRFQARAALLKAGYLAAVEAAMTAPGADPLAVIAWRDALEFERSSPTVLMMGDLLGLDAAALDELFFTASEIRA